MFKNRCVQWILPYFFILFYINSVFSSQWDGFGYAKNSSTQFSHAEWLLKNILLVGDEKILDLGSGDGKITVLLSKKVPLGTVIGIDPSDSMLDQAYGSCPKSDYPNVMFMNGTAEEFQIDCHFDHIFAFHVMHWIIEQKKALNNIHSHLNPNGKIHFILAPSKEGLPFHRALEKTLLSWKHDFSNFINPQQVFDIETYRRLLVDSGFHIDSLHYIWHDSIHENKEKLQDWIKQWSPHVKHLDGIKQHSFLDELISNYLYEMDLYPEHNTSVAWGEYILIIEGTKALVGSREASENIEK